MAEKAEQQIRLALEQLNAATDLTLPTAGQVWSRSQFRLAYGPRGNAGASHFGMLLAGLYVHAIATSSTWSGWSSIGLLTMGALLCVGSVGVRAEPLAKLSPPSN